MISLAVVYFFVSVALVVLAIFVHLHSTSLSLPVSSFTSIVTILLPIIAFVNACFHPSLLRRGPASSSRLAQLTPFVLQTLQGLVTTILATLLFESTAPSPSLECKIDSAWMDMFRSHDATGIRRIQDAFDCCGLNSVRDRAFPFPGMTPSTCAETYDRTLPCRGPWTSATQTTSGVGFAIAVFVGLMQIVGLLLMRQSTTWWSSALHRRREQTSGNGSRRPLLTAGIEDEEPIQQQVNGSRNYGVVNGIGPRVEPSLMNEGNAWNSDSE